MSPKFVHFPLIQNFVTDDLGKTMPKVIDRDLCAESCAMVKCSDDVNSHNNTASNSTFGIFKKHGLAMMDIYDQNLFIASRIDWVASGYEIRWLYLLAE